MSQTQPLLPTASLSQPCHSTPTHTHTLHHRAQHFLTSSTQHNLLLALITLDLLGIFADIIITLHQCDIGSGAPGWSTWERAREGLAVAGLVCSCLFVGELALSVWAFGLGYFRSPMHTLDALVIIASFAIDVVLHGVLEEIASLVVVLRLWRFFKIVEEFGVGATEQMATMTDRIKKLEAENRVLKGEIRRLRESGRTVGEEDEEL